MKQSNTLSTIAGHQLQLCPLCGAVVREDLRAVHSKHCPGRLTTSTTSPDTTAQRSSQPSSDKPGARKWRKSRTIRYPVRVQKPVPPVGRVQCPRCLMDVPEVHFATHKLRCTMRNAPPTTSQPSHAVTEKIRAQTKDGHPIATCWSCSRRICLVGQAHKIVAYDIVYQRSGSPHLCDGVSSNGRRSKLVYLDPRSINDTIPKRTKRKRS
jgi:hypothetical protein